MPSRAVLVLLALLVFSAPTGPALAQPALAQPVAQARTPFRVSIYASATSVAVGQEVVLTGKVRPHGPQAHLGKVKLQVVYDPQIGFETSALDRPDRYGKYVVSWSASTPGTYQVRARIAAGRNHSEGISQVLTVTVT